MSLTKYRQKRRFDETPEPRARPKRSAGALRFVVQKHEATRLHYDFRLELDGVLKSWAVPKGPSLNPSDKRLALQVEDHPFDYRTFEGTIPEGNYGAGTVMVWDEGTYTSRETANRKEAEQLIRAGLEKGHLSIVLYGKKLKGEFTLVKLPRGKGNAWLLVKKRDLWASDADITEKARSAISDRSMEEITDGEQRRRTKSKAKPSGNGRGTHRRWRASRVSGGSKDEATVNVPDAPTAKMPHHIRPMLATLVEEPFDRPGWLFEVKWDGYRAIAEVSRRGVAFYSRNHKSFEQRYAPLVESLRNLGHEAVLDGEVVVLDEAGKSQFQLLQNYQKTGKGHLRYYAFDLLYLDGRDLRDVPLLRRKELLAQILGSSPNLLLSEHVEESGIAFFEAASAAGLEGIIAKDGASPYREGRRSYDWLKIKAHRRQEAVIGGFTEPRGSRKNLGALLLGVYEGKDLVYIGHTGGGFDTKGLADMRAKLDPLVQRACPFRECPKANAPVHWVEPRLVCEVRFGEWTEDGIMRQPIFLGLRVDKPAHSVHREEPHPVGQALAKEQESAPCAKRRPSKRSGRTSPRRTAGDGKAGSPKPALTNLDKVFWPEEGYTKGDVIDYYRDIASVLLPYLRDRPQALHRHPNGITEEGFFQKDVSRQPPPDWVKTVILTPESGREKIKYVVCQDEASLLYLANLGCIEVNPWNSRIGSLDKPDYLIIDLDPVSIPFPKVVEAAVAVRKTLENSGAQSLCKTSGKRGLHIYVPLAAEYSYEQARRFAEIVAQIVHRLLPGSTSVARMPAQRQHRVYLDFLQNAKGKTLAAPYSVRPYPGATVSTPLKWQEVNKSLDPSKFTMRTTRKRLDKLGDLWKPTLGAGIDLTACLERLSQE